MSLVPLRNLLSRRALIGNLVLRDFQQRYVGSSMGWLWGFVHPAVMLASYWFVFGRVFNQKAPPDSGTHSFALFIFAGFLPWLLFQDSVQRSANSVVESSNLVTKTLFPSEVLPISIFFSNCLQHFLALLVLVIVAAAATGRVEPAIAAVPVYLALLALFTVGISWLVAGLQVFLRDTSQALAVIMTAWFWLTPIFFERDKLPALWMQQVARLNPLAQVVSAYRHAILNGNFPATGDLALLAGISGVTFIAGGLFFRRTKRAFGDVL